MKQRFLAATLLLLAAMVATPPAQARSYDDDDGGRSYARRYAPSRASREYREDDEGYRRPVYRGRRTTKPASRGRQRAIVRKQARPAAKVAAKPGQPQAPAAAGGANTVASNVADPGLAAGAKVASLAANAPADAPPPAALADDHGRQHVAVPGGPAPGNAPKMRACLTKAARELLDRIEAEFGPVQIVSTCRPGSRIPGSGVLSRHHHREAVDFEAGKRKGQIVKWLIANHKTGGIMTYSNFSHIHVDIGYRFVALNAHG